MSCTYFCNVMCNTCITKAGKATNPNSPLPPLVHVHVHIHVHNVYIHVHACVYTCTCMYSTYMYMYIVCVLTIYSRVSISLADSPLPPAWKNSRNI